jgi:hypothetical protein
LPSGPRSGCASGRGDWSWPLWRNNTKAPLFAGRGFWWTLSSWVINQRRQNARPDPAPLINRVGVRLFLASGLAAKQLKGLWPLIAGHGLFLLEKRWIRVLA